MSTPKAKVTTMTNVSKFEQQALIGLNKTEKDLKLEQIKDFVTNSLIETRSSISFLETSNLAKAKHELDKANRDLSKAENNYEKVKFEMACDFQTYYERRKDSLSHIEQIKSVISRIEAEIATIELNINFYKEILADLEA